MKVWKATESCSRLALPVSRTRILSVRLAGAAAALDMVYRTGETRWVRAMRAAGCRAADGRGMLVAQGAAALELWFPEADAPTEIMRAAVDAALR